MWLWTRQFFKKSNINKIKQKLQNLKRPQRNYCWVQLCSSEPRPWILDPAWNFCACSLGSLLSVSLMTLPKLMLCGPASVSKLKQVYLVVKVWATWPHHSSKEPYHIFCGRWALCMHKCTKPLPKYKYGIKRLGNQKRHSVTTVVI